ncbi:MAG: hypothetical protein E7231_01370 [Cellulosilyticum sp.]|nr:hypothetical protein [Cellulosilyticum sp.]
MAHLEWDDNDELQLNDDPSGLDKAAQSVLDMQNAYNNISDLLSNIGSNKEGDDMPPSSANNLDDSYDDDNSDNEIDDDNDDFDEDGINDQEESSNDDENGKSDIDKQNDKDSDGKDDSDEANEDNNSDVEDEDEDDDETDEDVEDGDGIVGRLTSGIKAKIAFTILKIKILLIAWAILMVLFLISTFANILTPDSLKAVLAYEFEAVTEGASGAWAGFTDAITSFFTNLFGGFSDTEGEQTDISVDGASAYELTGYEHNQQYNDSLKSNYTEIESALKASYALALKDAKAYCKQNGYSWWKSKKTLAQTNSDSWDKVYQNSNYGDILSVAGILLDEEQYESEEGYNPEEFDTARFSEFMKADSTVKHLYYISYYAKVDDNESNSSDANYVVITIYPYDVYSLFSMGQDSNDVSIGTQYSNKKWSATVDNYNFMRTRTDQIRAISNDENYELYHLDYDTPLNSERESNSVISTIANNVSLENVEGSNQKVVYQYLKAYGLSDVCIAGVMGNLQHENGFRTAMKGDQGSVGIAQWLGGRKTALINHAASLGLEVTDIRAQASYLVNQELQSQQIGYTVTVGGKTMNAYDAFITATDVQTATDIFCRAFERPANFQTEAGIATWKANNPKYKNAKFGYTTVRSNGWWYIGLDSRRASAQSYYNAIQNGVYD